MTYAQVGKIFCPAESVLLEKYYHSFSFQSTADFFTENVLFRFVFGIATVSNEIVKFELPYDETCRMYAGVLLLGWRN